LGTWALLSPLTVEVGLGRALSFDWGIFPSSGALLKPRLRTEMVLLIHRVELKFYQEFLQEQGSTVRTFAHPRALHNCCSA